MQTKKYKRIILCFLSILAAVSLLTAGVFAAETAEDVLIAGYQSEIDRILIDYLGSTTLPEDEILAKVDVMDWETYQTARWEISLLAAEVRTAIDNNEISVENLYLLEDKNRAFTTFTSALEEKHARDNPVETYASTSALDGHISVTNSGGSLSGTKLTAKGGFGSSGTTTATATVKNETSDKKITYTYKFNSGNNHKINDAKADATTGTHTLLPGQSIKYTFTTGGWFAEASVEFSGFSEEILESGYNVTFLFSEGTLTVDGESVTSGGSVNVATAGEQLIASATNIVGWINTADNSVIPIGTGKTNNFTLTVEGNMTLKAIHSTAPRFYLGNNYLYETLSAAITAASASGAPSKNIILANDGTLPAGNYTIPAGVTLLIPDSNGTVLTTEPHTTKATEYGVSPPVSIFRKLTMTSGANITVYGAISVGGTQWSGGQYSGSVTGAVGQIHMEAGSSITIGKQDASQKGNLYAWGFITGKGTVTVYSGSTVYEDFQLSGWRGGDVTTQMIEDKTYGVFPMTQYYVQNVEVPMTFHAGAREYAFFSVDVSLIGIQKDSFGFLGPDNAMFILSSGTVTKDYIEEEDRLYLSANGSISLGSVKMDIKITLGATLNIDSSTHVLPLNSNMTVDIQSGSATTAQDLALLPGAKIIIGKNATCTLGENATIYLYDSEQWGNYTTASNIKFRSINYAPGKKYTRTDADLVDAATEINGTIDATKGTLYTTSGGANIYSAGNGCILISKGTETVTYQITHDGAAKKAIYNEIPINSAWLRNCDDTFVKTGDTGAGEYHYINKFWHKDSTCSGGNATCTKKAVCDYCHKEYGSALGHKEVIDEGVAPTCTAPGKSEGKHCSECGEVLVAQQVLEANGHSMSKATCTEAATCSVCGATEGEALGHKWGWTEGVCSVCDEKAIRYDAVSLFIDGEIQLRLKYYVHDDAVKAGITVTVAEEANNIVKNPIPWTMALSAANNSNADYLTKDNEGRYVVSQGIAAGEMTGDVTVMFTINNAPVPIFDIKTNQEIGTSMVKKVTDFAQAAKDNNSDRNVKLSEAALTFGGYAQLFYGTHTGKLAYDFMKPEGATDWTPSLEGATFENVKETIIEGNSGVTASTQKLNLDSSIYIRTYFTLAKDKSNYSVKITRPTEKGTKLIDETGDLITGTDGRVYVDILNVPPAYWDNTYTITISEGDTVVCTVKTSVLAWCERCVNASTNTQQVNMAKAMYLYCQAANTYFGQTFAADPTDYVNNG